MGRMHKGTKGKSHSTRPISKTPPAWCKWKPEEVEELVVKLAKEGHSPSVIGLILRDQYGIPLVKAITGKKIAQILHERKLVPAIPEDLHNLINKAQNIRKHLERHRKDYSNKHALELLESKIHGLVKYYKRKGVLPPDWKYKPLVAAVD